MKDYSGSYAVLTGQGSSASHMTGAKVLGCAGQAAEAVSAYIQVKKEDAPRLLKIPKSACPDLWIHLPRHKWPKSWSNIEDSVVPLERNLKMFCWDLDGKKYRIGNVCWFIGNKDCSCRKTWMISKWLEGIKTSMRCGRN